MHGAAGTAWGPLVAHTVEDALPAVPPPWPLAPAFPHRARPPRLGDHRGPGSVQGALAGGARGREVPTDLGGAE